MNILIIILLILVAGIVVLLVAGLWIQKEYYIDRTVFIHLPKEKSISVYQDAEKPGSL